MDCCPICGGKEIGKISSLSYFCHHCYLEFNEKNEIFAITEDGGLEKITGGEDLWVRTGIVGF